MRGKQRQITIIGQERPFDEARWRQLLTAFAYVLHEQRQTEATADVVAAADDVVTEHDHPTAHLPVARQDEDG